MLPDAGLGAGKRTGRLKSAAGYAMSGRHVLKKARLEDVDATSPAEVEQGTYGEFLRASRSFRKGESIFFLGDTIQPVASKHSIQLDGKRHVVTENSIWRFTNHSCNPSMRIDTKIPAMVAVRDIEDGQELTFNYNTSEWQISSPFACGCGQPACLGEVRGFRHVPEKHRNALRPLLTPWLAERWEQEQHDIRHGKRSVQDIKPEVHVLISYEIVDGQFISAEYDNEDFRAEVGRWFEPLGLEWVWTRVAFENLAETIANLSRRADEREIVVFNLCDGSEIDGYPGLSVIRALDAAGLPYSGANAEFYEKTTTKITSKRMFDASGVATPPMVEVSELPEDIDRAFAQLGSPIILKPDVSAGSYGIGNDSVCNDRQSAISKVKTLRQDRYIAGSAIFAEPFVKGREFTVFAVEDDSEPLGLRILVPCERAFNQALPELERFCSYERHWNLPVQGAQLPVGEEYCVHLPVEGELRDRLAALVRRAVRAVSGSSYARCDVRLDQATDALLVLEVNSQCELSSDPKSEIGSILQFSRLTMSGLLDQILSHALARADPA
jgi:D-alanine-D-alanine ligase